jgi:hypothetical protein
MAEDWMSYSRAPFSCLFNIAHPARAADSSLRSE